MKLNKASIISGSIALGLMWSGHASAGIYAGARMIIENLTINITGVIPPATTSYQFDIQNTAALTPGGGAFTFNTCSAQAAGPCNATLPGDVQAGTVLSALPAQVGIALAPQTYSFQGPGNLEYARADSAIVTAQLVDGTPTSTINIAEAELQTGVAASGTSTVQSSTGFSFTFSVGGPGTFQVAFQADPALQADINDALATTANAQASHSVQLVLTQDTGTGAGASVSWSPTNINNAAVACNDGDVNFGGVGITCGIGGEISDENLNDDVTVSTLPVSNDQASLAAGFGNYFLEVDFANAGTYTLALVESKSVLVTRQQVVPEPGVLVLLGSGLLGLGLARRSRKRALQGN